MIKITREFLFRGKIPDFGEWVEGGISDYDSGVLIYEDDTFNPEDVISETVGQYTGSSDKNKKKIFEDDIVVVTDAFGNKVTYVVEYKQAAFCLTQLGVNYSTYLSDFDNGEYEIEIIGNIHDNPELLKGE